MVDCEKYESKRSDVFIKYLHEEPNSKIMIKV